jgi:hypothetical protein
MRGPEQAVELAKKKGMEARLIDVCTVCIGSG